MVPKGQVDHVIPLLKALQRLHHTNLLSLSPGLQDRLG